MNYIVNISHLDEDELSFFGWNKVSEDEHFVLYWNARYNERQIVEKGPAKFLLVDDLNDAWAMSRDSKAKKSLIQGPQKAQ